MVPLDSKSEDPNLNVEADLIPSDPDDNLLSTKDLTCFSFVFRLTCFSFLGCVLPFFAFFGYRIGLELVSLVNYVL